MWNHQPLQHPPREETRRLFVQTWTLSRQHYTVQSLYFNVQCTKRDCILFALHYFSFASICFSLSVVWKHPISLNLVHIRQCRLGKFSETLVTRPFWWTLQMSPLARWGLDAFSLHWQFIWHGQLLMPHFTDLHRGCLRSAQSMRTYPCHGTPLCFHFACIQKKESAHVNLKHSKGVMLGPVGSLACGVLKKRASCVVALSTFRCGPYDGLVMSFGDAHHPTEAEFFIEKTMSDDSTAKFSWKYERHMFFRQWQWFFFRDLQSPHLRCWNHRPGCWSPH